MGASNSFSLSEEESTIDQLMLSFLDDCDVTFPEKDACEETEAKGQGGL